MTALPASTLWEGICPNCGNWDVLDDRTGFCIKCTQSRVVDTEPGVSFCKDCGERVAQSASRCWACKHRRFLTTHADEIETLQIEGFSHTEATKIVLARRRRYCLSCGDLIPKAQPHTHFCRRHTDCKTAYRRFRTLRESFALKGFTDPYHAALSQVKRELSDRKET